MENADTIDEILAGDALARVAADLRRLVRPAIRVHNRETGDDSIPVGVSKIGGLPDLPPHVPYPYPDGATVSMVQQSRLPADPGVPLSFIAQIRLADSAGLIEDSPLPDSGLLSFFYNDFYQGQVLFTADDEPLIRRTEPKNAQVYTTYSALFEPMLLPAFVETCHINDPRWEGRGFLPGTVSLTRDEWDLYAEWTHSEYIANVDHLLGYSQDAQPYAMENSYQSFRPLLFPDLPDWDKLSWEEKHREHEGNLLLLQIEPKDHPMHFGRGGAVYFFMRRADLLNRDFSKAWAWSQ